MAGRRSIECGAFLRATRLRHNLGQAELARRVGTDQPAISRIERDVVSPTLETLNRIFEAMGETLALSSPEPGGDGARGQQSDPRGAAGRLPGPDAGGAAPGGALSEARNSPPSGNPVTEVSRLEPEPLLAALAEAKSFTVLEASAPLFRRLAEDYLVEPTGEDSCRFTWTIAVDPRLPNRLADPVNRRLLGTLFRDTRKHFGIAAAA